MSRIVQLRILGSFTALLFLAMVIHAAPLKPSIPTIHFTFSEASFNSILAQWQPAGVARFKWHFAIDFPAAIAWKQWFTKAPGEFVAEILLVEKVSRRAHDGVLSRER